MRYNRANDGELLDDKEIRERARMRHQAAAEHHVARSASILLGIRSGEWHVLSGAGAEP